MFHHELLIPYLKKYSQDIATWFENLKTRDSMDFSYMTESSALYSANIEGNTLDLNSFMNLRGKSTTRKKEVTEIENLIASYEYARVHPLDEKHFLKSHALSSKTLLPPIQRGKYRSEKVGVFGESGLIYLAIEPEKVSTEMGKFFQEIEYSMSLSLEKDEVLFIGSMIHLVFVHIHPFADGNGRSARLLEKWWLATKLGDRAWMIPSEEYYWKNRHEYYRSIALGVNYYELDYTRALPFCRLIVKSLESIW